MPSILRPVLSIVVLFLAQSGVGVAAGPDAGMDGAYLAGRVAQAARDPVAAALWFDRALLADPTNTDAIRGAISAHMTLGQFDQAVEPARILLQRGTRDQTAALAVLADRAARDDYAGILADLTAGQSVGRLLNDLAASWADVGLGKMNDASAGFDRVTAQPGLETFGLYHKALALASAGDFQGAEKAFSDPRAGLLGNTRRSVLARAQVLSQLERDADALALLDRAFGSDADPQVQGLRAALRAGEVVPFDAIRTPRDGMAEVFYTLATALNGQADNGFTLIYARIAIHLRPDLAEAQLMAAGLLMSQDLPLLASDVYAAIPPESPAYVPAQIGKASALNAQDQGPAATEALRDLARNYGNRVEVQVALGDSLRRSEHFAEAERAYDAAITLMSQPGRDAWAVYYARGIARERQNKWPGAQEDLRRALALSPNQPQVLNYLGYSYVDRQENLDEALTLIQKAVQADPTEGFILDSLAWAYFRLGRYADAVEPMERASLLEPVDPIVTDHLGDVYWSVGRRVEARYQWNRALIFKPEEKDAKRIRQKLQVGLDAVRKAEGDPPFPQVSN